MGGPNPLDGSADGRGVGIGMALGALPVVLRPLRLPEEERPWPFLLDLCPWQPLMLCPFALASQRARDLISDVKSAAPRRADMRRK